MAKSIRSKVKRAFRQAARERLAERERERLEQATTKLYERVGFRRRAESESVPAKRKPMHRGMEVHTNFVPTPDPVQLNCVHGPLAEQKKESSEHMVLTSSEETLVRAPPAERVVMDVPMRRVAPRSSTNSQRREPYRPRGKKKHAISLKPISKRHPLNRRVAWKQKRS
jgi:hypothetical protein